MTNTDMSSFENDDIIRNNVENKTVDFNTAKLLSKINEMMICPMSFLEIKGPLCGPDKMSYEKVFIGKCLQHQITSLVTREPMT